MLAGITGMTFLLVTNIFDRVQPSILEDLKWNAVRGAHDLAEAAEYGIVLGDKQLVAKALEGYHHQSDVLGLVVTDIQGTVLLNHGAPPER